MKIGVRKPSIKKSFKARTTGKVKRKIKRTINPFYGKKGLGFIKNPKKSIYNKVYRKTTFSPFSLANGIGGLILGIIVLPFWLMYLLVKLIIKGLVLLFSAIWAFCKNLINKKQTDVSVAQVAAPEEEMPEEIAAIEE